MSPQIREHMFDPFFTTKPTGCGTGLKLSVSHGIILQHHGTITADTRLHEGSTMRIELPLSPVEPAGNTTGASVNAEEEAESSEQCQALVIDDEETILEMLSDALARMNCRTTLLNGSAGVEAELARCDFDLVMCDLKMPGQNGLETFRFIQREYPELAERFVLMTGNLVDADEHASKLAGVTILPKPFTLAQLRETLRRIMEKHAPAPVESL